MIDVIKFSLISSVMTLAVACVMWFFGRKDVNSVELYNDGLDLLKKKRYQQAIAKFNAALKQSPKSFRIHYNIGLAYLYTKNYDKSKEAFNQALQLNPSDVDTIFNLGLTEIKLKNYDNATGLFERALDNNPEDSESLFNLAYICYLQNKLPDAIQYLTKAVEISPERTDYKRFHILILHRLTESGSDEGNFVDELLKTCLDLLIVYPNDEDLIFEIAVAYAKKGDWESSVQYCERLVNQNPNSARACNQFGLTLFCKGETRNAIEMYENAIKSDANFAETYVNLAFAYDKLSQHAKAVKLCEQFIKKFPGHHLSDIAQNYINEYNSDEKDEYEGQNSEEESKKDSDETNSQKGYDFENNTELEHFADEQLKSLSEKFKLEDEENKES